jgi:non-ribosomal peptide synthetase component F
MIVNLLKLQRDINKNPMFEILFNYLNIESDERLELNDLKIEEYEINSIQSKFDFTMNCFNFKNNFKILIEYNEKYFSINTINRISIHFKKIINKILKNNEIKINEIEILSKEEKNKFIEFNKTEKINPNKNKLIQEIFE